MEMNMDVRPEQLIDIALTCAQIIVAGLLGMVAYSWRARKRRGVESEGLSLPNIAASPTGSISAEPLEGKHTIHFVSLAPKQTERLGGIRDSLVEARRRNRADIIRQARQMIEQGAANNDITSRLRVTEGELSLLRQDINR